ncbi:MAG: hypothetical protein ACXVHB_05845 [Solirubrobacteraceae bacterium]
MTVVAKRDVTEIETYTGAYIDLVNPAPWDIHLEDIASGLAKACRFGNQVTRFYSVAEHAVRCSRLVAPGYELAALHHDSHEAYIGDITAPLKQALRHAAPGVLETIATNLDIAICEGLDIGLDPAALKHPHVKEIDDICLYREAAALKYSHGIGEHWGNDAYYKPFAGIGWSPAKAEREFLKRHNELCGQHS